MADFASDSPTYPNADDAGPGAPAWVPVPPTGPPTAPEYGGYAPPPAARPSTGAAAGRRTILVTAVAAALVGGAVGATTVALDDHSGSSSAVSAGLNFSTQAPPTVPLDGSVSAAAAKIGPSVVTIDVISSQGQATGSGVIIRADGYVLTNNHVVASAAAGASVLVTLKDGRRTAGKVVGADTADDLAVVKIAITGLRAAAFASSARLIVGQTVVAVGAPLGLSDTVTSGIVSNVARPVMTGNTSGTAAAFDAVQTDAAINPGNSGGPLVNLSGDVVGINAAIAADPTQGGLQVPGQTAQSTNIGIGFAIPSDEASRIAAELIATGSASHAVLGVQVQQSTSVSAVSPGAVIETVTSGGPAAAAGFQVGDIVTKLDDQLIPDGAALVAAIRSHAPGDSVTASVLRHGAVHSVAVKLGRG